MKSILITTITLLVASLSYAQRQNVYFLKNDRSYVDSKDSADYMRVIREPDSASTLYNVFEFYINGNKKLIGKSLIINPPVFEGQCMTFYPNGSKELLSNYKNGSKVGDEIAFFPNGKVYLSKTYLDATPFGTGFEDDSKINILNDSLGKAMITDGNGYYIGYDDKFKYIEEEGNVKNGSKDGSWNGEDKNLGVKFTGTYDNGNLVNGIATTKDEKTINYSKSRQVYPQFRGGLPAFGSYLSNHIKYPDYARARNIQGSVIIEFVVEKAGELTDIKVKRPVDSSLDDEAVRVLRLSPKWIPGTRFGIPVRVRYSVPVRFTLSN